ncbi:hypothetical protein [Virgibacillus sp. CBA3643]|uniref:hypothetical protein n=1 Tax=Virgibacillus sp. CBA3643 TaxID=2942278 RepID=UPI0035A264BA
MEEIKLTWQNDKFGTGVFYEVQWVINNEVVGTIYRGGQEQIALQTKFKAESSLKDYRNKQA